MTSTHLDQTMIALADPTRRAILRRLSSGEARVTEVAQPFNMSLSAVSKHILILERARLVQRRIEGRDHYLSASTKPLEEAAGWIEEYRHAWEQRLDRLGDHLEKMQEKQRKGRRVKNPNSRS